MFDAPPPSHRPPLARRTGGALRLVRSAARRRNHDHRPRTRCARALVHRRLPRSQLRRFVSALHPLALRARLHPRRSPVRRPLQDPRAWL
eukprot:3697591-Prymnesium_polylepis.1